MLLSSLPHRRHLRAGLLALVASVIGCGWLLPASAASAVPRLECHFGTDNYDTVLCGFSKEQGGAYCAKASHETSALPTAGYLAGSTSQYRIRFQAEGLTGCNPAGVRTVTYFQELRNGPTGAFIRSSASTTRATNERFLLNAVQTIPQDCSTNAPGSAVRAVVRLGWRPYKGWGGAGAKPAELASKPLAVCSATAATHPRAARAASSSPTYLDQPGLNQAVQPAAFMVADYNDPHDPNTVANAAVSGVSWSSWGSATAEGTGHALIQWTDATTGLHNQERATVPVLVIAGGLRTCGGVSVYTTLNISLAAGATAPPYFAQVQRDSYVQPCAVHAGNYVAGRQERSDPNGCFFKGVRELIIQPPFSLGYCAMRWKDWGSSTATGEGVARIGFKQYGIRVKLAPFLPMSCETLVTLLLLSSEGENGARHDVGDGERWCRRARSGASRRRAQRRGRRALGAGGGPRSGAGRPAGAATVLG